MLFSFEIVGESNGRWKKSEFKLYWQSVMKR